MLQKLKSITTSKLEKRLVISIQVVAMVVLLIAYLGVFTFALFLRNDLQKYYNDASGELESVATDSLSEQSDDALAKLADVQTEATNERFSQLSNLVDQSVEYLGLLYADPSSEENKGHDMDELQYASAEKPSGRWMLSPGVTMTRELQDELNLISNLELLVAPNMKTNPVIDDVYFASASGIFYQYTAENDYDPNYEPRERDWYKQAVASPSEIVWLEPYWDAVNTDAACITLARVLQDENGTVLGVVGCDIVFGDVMNSILANGLGETGTEFIIGPSNRFVALRGVNDYQTFDASLEAHFANPDTVKSDLAKVGSVHSRVFREIDYIDLNGSTQRVHVAVRKIEANGWYFCTALNEDEIQKPIDSVVKGVTESAAEYGAKLKTKFRNLALNTIMSFLLIFIITGVLAAITAKKITRPIVNLTDKVDKIGDGNFDVKVERETDDEIGDLADKFNEMQDDLKQYTENLKSVTAEKERIGAELNVATQIQADMLPRIFPPFPEKSEVDIYATMEPAKEVGGDFYDFFLVDDDHLAFVIADVSGKGVPAALFMVISKTLIKNRAQQGGTPAEILADVNNHLCEGNDAEFFVTAWLGILELSTGIVTAANAGHEFPAIRDANGKFTLLKDKHGFVMAGMENMKYRDYKIQLEENGGFFVYTDGVPEATNADNELFGTDRMLASLNKEPGADPVAILQTVRTDVEDFVGEAPQFDDVTMVGLVWKGPESTMKKLVTDAKRENLAEVQSFVDEGLEEHNSPMAVTMQIQVAVEEIFTNIASYAYPDGDGKVQLCMEFSQEEPSTMTLRFLDSGIPFDPLAKADPDVTLSAEERQIGGLGIYMVKKTMDEVSYDYKDGKNIFTMKKKLVVNKEKQ